MMAPRGSSRGQTTQPGRALRGGVGGGGRSRGGIQKRRGGGPTRIDIDGDLDMEAGRRAGSKPPSDASQPPRGPRVGRTTMARGVSRTAQAIARHLGGDNLSLTARVVTPTDRRTRTGGLTWLKVRGLKESKAANNEGGGLKDLLGFLERKASPRDSSRKVTIRKSRMAGDLVFVGATPEDAEELLKLNTFMFAGAPLEITLDSSAAAPGAKDSAGGQPSADTLDLKTRLQSVLSLRYDGAAKLLKLNALAQDATLVELGSFEHKERAEKTFHALMKICDDLFKTVKEKEDAIQSISLAGNNIDDVTQVDSVANTFRDLKHLDLSGNQLGSTANLAKWKNKFRRLETIYLAGNPVIVAEPAYANTLLEMFPRLQYLDGVQVRSPEQVAQAVAQAAAARQPKPLPQHGPDFRDTNGIGEAFLLEFFAAFDADRQALLAKYYDDASNFSLSVDTVSVRDANAPPPMPWASYLKFSRNLKKITTDHGRHQRLFRGRALIFELWRSLPVTKHPDIKTETSKYVMDCHSLAGIGDPSNQAQRGVDGMVISVHGEFEEMDKDGKTGKRSFSRTFILGPGLPGGSQIRVVSDMLCLRANNPLPNIFEQPAAVAALPVAALPVAAQPVAAQPAATHEPALQNQQELLIIELSKQTGMTAEYSKMCLEQASWNFQDAVVLYEATRQTLPAEAWVVAPMPQKGTWN